MPIIDSQYRPPLWCTSKHLQTILPVRLRKVDGVEYSQERLSTPDQDFIDLNWVFRGYKKLAVLTYGIVATKESAYVLGMVKRLSSAGYDALVWDFRGSQTPNYLRRFYHAGNSDDLAFVLEHANKKEYTEIILVGFSFGGNIVLKYLGERGNSLLRKISQAVVISVPCDLKKGSQTLVKRRNVLYCRDFLGKSLLRIAAKKKAYPEEFSDIFPEKICNPLDFDEQVTAPLHGFRNAEHYYEECSSKRYISGISLPTLILNAQNDPIIPLDSFPIRECKDSRLVSLEMPIHGGHVGFPMKRGLYYSEERVGDSLFGKNGENAFSPRRIT